MIELLYLEWLNKPVFMVQKVEIIAYLEIISLFFPLFSSSFVPLHSPTPSKPSSYSTLASIADT